MSPWKVILATLVIFCSGLAVGALLVKKTQTVSPPHFSHRGPTNLPAWNLLQKELVRKMDRELNLSPEQRTQIEKLLKESQERTKEIRETIAPVMREEMKKVREQIRAELNPEQQEEFEKSMKAKLRKPGEQNDEFRRKKDGVRGQTNATSTNLQPANP